MNDVLLPVPAGSGLLESRHDGVVVVVVENSGRASPSVAGETETIKILAKECKSLRQQRAKKDYTIARLRTKVVSLEATVKAQEEQLKDWKEKEKTFKGETLLSDDDDYEEDEDLDFHTDVEGYEFMETGEDGFIPIDVDDGE
ncbi:hypothetical protein QYE76_017488 [Lolium multiflorum]|uniref:Uncharacterized protein n=1 Tax=Lolium multiflorum TaxID=4521 RepID=A0AAD8QFR8_LOLMU|nr:hypothetical protein QYE76_017488 [Lolium multiflorum]